MLFIVLYLLNLYIRLQDWMPFFYGWPVDYLVMIPALFFSFMIHFQNKDKLVRIPQYRLLAALLIVIFLSNIVNGHTYFGLLQFIRFGKFVCIFIIVLLLVNSTKKLQTTMFLMVVFSLFLAIQVIAQQFSGSIGIAGQGFSVSGVAGRARWVGLWDGPNVLSLLFNVSIAMAIEFVFGHYSFIWRLINFISGVILIYGVYATNSRGGFLTLLIIMLTYPIIKLRKRKIAIIIGIALAALFFVYLAPSRINQINTSERSANIRTRLWGNAKDMFRENPILGIGKGRFILENHRRMAAHSSFMENLPEIGGVGIFIWVGLIYFSFKGIYYVYKIKPELILNDNQERLKSLAIALFVSLLGFNFCTLFVTMEIEIFYLLLGLCAAVINIMNKEIKEIEMRFSFNDVKNICFVIIGMLTFYHLFTL